MTDRERLVELLNEASEILLETAGGLNDNHGNGIRADHLIANGVTVQEWFPVSEPPKKNGRYLIFTKLHFVPDHVDEPNYTYGLEISGYYEGHGFLSTNGLFAEYWTYPPQLPKEVMCNGTADRSNRS